ncbi:MAG: sugar phosphate isomerase/epimerase [Pedosphaera sp.]|nr:sugar phosphate isomerase/epimerase [Pedosphaera sp.]
MYSLSSCWNSGRHTDGRAMLREIRDLGFEYAELSHGIRLSLVPGIIDAVEAGEIKISTVHNFCPLPMGVNYPAPNIFKFSSADRREREYAWKHSLKSIETAERVGAKLIVLHSGQADLKDYNEPLEELRGHMKVLEANAARLLAEGQQDSKEFRKTHDQSEKLDRQFHKLLEEIEYKRERRKEEPMQLALEIITRLADEAGRRGILLGIENREAIEEIPFDHDIPFFLDSLPENVVKYWHDCGHAQIKEHLGLIPSHLMHLETLAPRLAGFHVHDVILEEDGAHDHCPPGSGIVPFAQMAVFVKPEHIKVVELSPGVTTEDVRRGFEIIRSLWGPE